MTDADRDRIAARTVGTPPQVLTDIALRRPDLHANIAANPGATPELIRWINGVRPTRRPQPRAPQLTQRPSGAQYPNPRNASSVPPSRSTHWRHPQNAPFAVPKKGKVGCWFAGCGCLVVVAFIGLFAFAGLGGVLGLSDSESAPSPSVETTPESDDAADLTEHLELYEQERTRIDELSVALDGNPVKPPRALFDWMEDQDAKMAEPNVTVCSAESIAAQMSTFRADLEQSIADAEARRGNASGSLSEGLVDAAGNGFIDVQFDAATACDTHANADQGYRTTGCVNGGSPLVVHLLPAGELTEWHSKINTVHELAHVFQRADDVRYPDDNGGYEVLLAQGLFQGSEEAMADCYALTYFNEWTLSDGVTESGYGYICGDNERQAIRDWAAGINAPLG